MSTVRYDFSGKVVAITGAGGILCGSFAEAFAKAGAKVALLDLNKEAVFKKASEIRQAGGIAYGYEANVLQRESLEEARAAIEQDLGLVDILVNGAGGNSPKATTDNEFHEAGLKDLTTFFDLEQAGIEFVFNLNYLGTLLPTQVFAAGMVGKTGATIINISSMNAYTPLTKIPAYSGAKAAVSNLTQWLAVHFSKVGIRCNAIAPGFLVSNQNRGLLYDEEGQLSERGEKIINNTPMARFGEAEELIGGLFFLANEETASFVNGVILPIDGGFSAYSGV